MERGEKKDESGSEGAAKDGEEKDRAEKAPARRTEKLPDGRTHIIAERIFLARAFPFDMKSEYISVLDRDPEGDRHDTLSRGFLRRSESASRAGT